MGAFLMGAFLIVGGFFIFFVAWATHIFMSIKLGLWGMLFAGTFVFPVGIVHGIGFWFGWWS